jgi:hypothetical protein
MRLVRQDSGKRRQTRRQSDLGNAEGQATFESRNALLRAYGIVPHPFTRKRGKGLVAVVG